MSASSNPKVLQLPVDAIARDPDQPRRHVSEESLAALAEGIRARSVLQPVTVTRNARPDVEAPYLLLFGERRFLAAIRAGLAEVPAILREEEIPPTLRILLQLTENEQREDLTLLDRALAYHRAFELSGQEPAAFADQAGLNRSLLSRYFWIARTAGFIREALEANLLRHLETARLYSRLPAGQQLRLLREARRHGEPITLSKVHRAQAAAEASLVDPLEIDSEMGGDDNAGPGAAPALPSGARGSLPAGPVPDTASGIASRTSAVINAPGTDFTGAPGTTSAGITDASPLAGQPGEPGEQQGRSGTPADSQEATVLLRLTASALAALLRRLGLTPLPDPDEAVRSLMRALLVETL